MKKAYEKPEIFPILVAQEDVIATSTLKLYDSSNGVSQGEDIFYW